MFTFVNIIDLQNLQIQINKKYIKDLCSKIPSIFCQIFNSVLKRKSTEILYDDMITLKKKLKVISSKFEMIRNVSFFKA